MAYSSQEPPTQSHITAIIVAITKRPVPIRFALDGAFAAFVLESASPVGPTVADGERDGMVDGTGDGPSDGSLDASADGPLDGPTEGLALGTLVGLTVDPDGAILCVGAALGTTVGDLVGLNVGAEGALVGETVGTGGTSVEQTSASKEEQSGAKLSNCAAVSKRLAKGQVRPVLLKL
jgi:hypothetical protein